MKVWVPVKNRQQHLDKGNAWENGSEEGLEKEASVLYAV